MSVALALIASWALTLRTSSYARRPNIRADANAVLRGVRESGVARNRLFHSLSNVFRRVMKLVEKRCVDRLEETDGSSCIVSSYESISRNC